MGNLTSPAPLWDLRNGDADDNRTSPKSRGWWNLVLSTTLEFNFLTASLAFVWLILVPTLLVGLLPSVLIELGRRKLGTTVLLATYPFAAVLSLAALVGAALWITRPLVAMTLDNFWHLHHTLVFPVFVALRETVCAFLERFLAPGADAVQLARTRRAGTVLATLLLASAGVLLASLSPFSVLAGLDDIRSVNPRTLATAALGNTAVVLGVSTVFASLYWFLREISVSRPVRNWAPGSPAPAGAHTLHIAHLSDLHVVGERYGYRMEPGTSGPCGNGRVAHAVCELDKIQADRPLDRILITGDITDAGTRAEWMEFLDLFQRRPDLRHRVLFVPGNHDVNVVDRTNPGRLDLPWSVAQAVRKLRVILALDAVQGACVHVVDRASGTLGPSLQEYLRTGERANLLRGLADRGTWRGRWEVVRVWDRIFPLVVPPSPDGCGFILLDSNARRHFSLTNAIGVIGREQLRALASILRTSRGRAWIVLVHHHLVEYPIRSLGLDERIGVALVNAPDVLKAIASHGAPVLVLHGHRHRGWIGTRGDVVLCSAPSVTFGDKGSQAGSGSFFVHDVAFASDGRIWLSSSERVAVA